MKTDYTYNAVLTRVIDGDTIECIIDFGFKITQVQTIRLAHINAPELPTPAGEASKAHIITMLTSPNLLLHTFKPRDKYGRYLAEVYMGQLYVNQQMITDGFAVAYEG